MTYQSNPRTEAARHYCRKVGCDFVVGPAPKAHQSVRQHRATVHGLSAMVGYCNAECGYRARPHEGRYTNPLTGRSEQITDSRALATKEERIAAAQAEQAAFDTEMANARFMASVERGRRDERVRRNTWPAKRYGCPCAQCRHS